MIRIGLDLLENSKKKETNLTEDWAHLFNNSDNYIIFSPAVMNEKVSGC